MTTVISVILHLFAIVSSVQCLIHRNAVLQWPLLCILCSCICWALMLIFPDRFSTDSTVENKFYHFGRSLWFPTLVPELAVLYQVIMVISWDTPVLWRMLILCILGGGIITGLHIWRYPDHRKNVNKLCTVFLIAAVLTAGILGTVNQWPESVPEEQIAYTVLSKDTTKTGKNLTLRCSVSYPSYEGSSVCTRFGSINLPIAIYQQVDRGATVMAYRYEGNLGVPYTRLSLSDKP